MITLLTTIVSFLAGGLPKLLAFFQDRGDKRHELELARLQFERELTLAKEGFAAQTRVEEIRTDQIALQTAVQERQALYAHDSALGEGASQWVINARAMVRPVVTYGLLLLFFFIEVAGLFYALTTGVAFIEAINQLWDYETQLIWSSVIAFWFGTQAFNNRK